MIGPCTEVLWASCPDPEYVRFVLYTRDTAAEGEILDLLANNISLSKFKHETPTKIVLHGFTSKPDDANLVAIRTEYFRKGHYNIIAVDWRVLAQGPQICYAVGFKNIQHVGECVGQLVQRLRKEGATDIHVIGHSLGAQTANYVAKYVRPKLQRITGLDPAGPLFTGSDAGQLDKSDAVFVDVIHTNAEQYGKLEAIGHVDFYVNNGKEQPGCAGDSTCSHSRSVEYFAESITSKKGFYGSRCENVSRVTSGQCVTTSPRDIKMGDSVSAATTGIIEVPTASESPFALGKYDSTPTQDKSSTHVNMYGLLLYVGLYPYYNRSISN